MNILSLGAGVQSTAILLASAKGILPKIDYAIFADTGWEPQSVYDHLDRIEREIAQPAGIPIFRVSAGNIRDELIDESKQFLKIPVHILKKNGGRSIGQRQCTNIYKVRPVCEKIRELLGAETFPDGRVGRVGWYVQVDLQIGISTDEIIRAKPSKVKYVNHTFPLLDIGWSRDDCSRFLAEHGFGETPKSSCIGCPFKKGKQWHELLTTGGPEWDDAVFVDETIRSKTGSNPDVSAVFLNSTCKPLSEFSNFDDDDMLDLFSCSPFSCKGDESLNGVELIRIGGDSDAYS